MDCRFQLWEWEFRALFPCDATLPGVLLLSEYPALLWDDWFAANRMFDATGLGHVGGAIVGFVYGFIDGFIYGFFLAWIYNFLAGRLTSS